MSLSKFDIVIIGSGPGGYKAAITAAQLGSRVALIESRQQGGTCLNKGCIPKNTLLHLAKLIEDVNQLNGKGINGTISGDFTGALEYKEEVVSQIRDNFPVWLRRLGVHQFAGHASFVNSNTIQITDDTGDNKTISTKHVIIATGSRERKHPNVTTDGSRILNSYDFLTRLDQLPESILIIGGGAIGAEFGFLLHQYGSRVTIVEQSSRMLNKTNIPERASMMLERKFKRLGVDIRKNTGVLSAVPGEAGVDVNFSSGEKQNFDYVLVAIGREPCTSGMGLEHTGIDLDKKGFIKTNQYLETSVDGIFAVGDVKAGPMTANAALHDGKVAATNAVGSTRLTFNYHIVPIVIDTALEIAAVGLTEEMAESAGFEPDVARGNFSASPKARGRQDTEGFIEVVHDEETGQMLGGCIVGSEAGEQIQMLTAACQSPRGLWLFTDINYSHPSWCEELEHAIYPYTNAFSESGKDIFHPGIYAIRHKS
ncbi:MAG TPA: NAD(P)/FAD-dependent oxidoreductase [Gammaproteobacteria bacterium]|nr:NAD(P)/FAD-dependent oxidoreductase [Gammaproteobacteria bacterium]